MSSGTCGVSSSSSSIFGGLCSGNSRRPSMFTAKYRLREERKKVLKMSMAKVKRIEDPESFLRRSVLINNTIKRLQREVREEKMMRHGGYSSKLSCSSFRKSYACSRLSDMHIPDDDSPLSSSSSLSRHNNYNNSSLTNNNGRKRALSDEGEDDCDVQAVLSQIYIPPTPCIISSIDEDDCCDSSGSSPSKKAKMSLSSHHDDPASLLVTDECSLEVDVDVDVDVVGDSETSDWPTPPEPQSEMIIVTPSVIDSSVANDSIEAAIDSMESASSCLSQRSSVAIVGDVDDNVVDVDDCEFSLDLPPSPPMSACSAIGTADEEVVVTTEARNVERQVSSSHESQVDLDDMTTSSDAKENNTCTLKLSSCCSSSTPAAHLLIPSTITATTDPNCCDTTPTNHATITAGIPAGDNSFIDTTDLSSTSSSTTSSSPTSLSSALPTTSSQQQQQQQQQYSSCGHSSIFGELQSVVFHSLIASLET